MDHPLCPPDLPCRLGWWNIPIPLRIVFFIVMAISVAIMGYGLWQRYRLWRRGQPAPAFDRPAARALRTLKYALAQTRVLRQRYGGVMHLLIFWPLALFFIGTVLGSLDTDVYELIFKAKLLKGNFYLAEKLVLDLAALFALIGLGLALYRRLRQRPAQLTHDARFYLTLGLLSFIVLSGLIVEALRLATLRPVWAPYSVVAYPLSWLLRGIGSPGLEIGHRVIWALHFLGVAALIALLPATNLLHVITAPLNIFLAPLREKGALRPIADLEHAEQLGVSRVSHFSWPQLVNFDACTECGRCQVVCPAFAAGQPLNPKQLVLDLRRHMTAEAEVRAEKTGLTAMVGDVIKPEALWACTTCYHCVAECPVLIEHVDAMVDMRRHLALMEGAIPASLAKSLTNIERSGNPWKQPKRKRAAWTAGLDFEIPIMANVGEADVLWWVGCAGAYDARNQQVTQAIAKILHAGGVDFAILGDEETCTGDSARRAGNEYLFQQLARQNIETLNRYRFKLILTQCPHCYNTLLNEYGQFGGHYQVMHHTQYIEALLAEGQIKVKAEVEAGEKTRITFHDPCYLGRYNDEYEAPRYVAGATGLKLVEMARSRAAAMCCGGGGARAWLEDVGETRINYTRLAQIQETGCTQVGVACPFCLIMLEDARGARGAETLVIRDVAEIVAEALG